MNKTNEIADTLKQNTTQYKKKLKKSSNNLSKKVKKNHHIFLQSMVLLVVSGLILFSNAQQSGNEPTVRYNSGFGGALSSTTVDEVSSAEVAKAIARDADLIVADNVANLADSLSAKIEFATTYDSYLAKPQIVATEVKTRDDIVEYTTKSGDSISKIAKKYNVTSDSIKWANDLYSDAIGAGKKLIIPPVTGVIHTVTENDTPESLAQKYNANAAEIIAFNDAEVDGLPVGEKIVIPDGERKDFQQTYFATPTPAPQTTTYGYAFGGQPLYGGNGYSYGYCTWHAANRRAQIGKPIPRNLGNAVTWASLAAQAGFKVTENPIAGAVLWHKDTYIAGGYGHVGFVERMNPDGSIEVSDMNYQGWNIVSTRIIQPNEFGSYLFIH